MSTALDRITFTDEQVDLIKRTVAPDLNTDELAMFVHYAQSRGLDPLSREVYAFKNGGRVSMGVGIDGLRRNAMQSSGRCYAPGRITYGYDKAGNLESATATVKRWYPDARQWMEAEYTAWLSECKRPTPIWNQRTKSMLGKCAEAGALRQMFPEYLGPDSMIVDGREPLEQFPDAIQVEAEVIDVPVVEPDPFVPPIPEQPKRSPGRPRKHADQPPPPPPVEVAAEPAPEPPARPVAPFDGVAERTRIKTLAAELGVDPQVLGRLRQSSGLPVDPTAWTPDGVAELEAAIRSEAARGKEEF